MGVHNNMLINETCPVCTEGTLTSKVTFNTVQNNNYTTKIPLFFSICDTCGCEQADSNELELNKTFMLFFKYFSYNRY